MIIDSEHALAQGLAALRAIDPVIDRLVGAGAQPVLRKREPGCAGLVSIVVGQQVSTASAAAILRRLNEAVPGLTSIGLAAAPDDILLAAGLSRPKLRTLRAITEAIMAGHLPIDSLHAISPADAHARLTGVTGIGPWTADVYHLFCLGHPDILPAGDLALQEAARIALDLPTRPDARTLSALAERWRPWRGVAALVLWALYRQAKSRDGAPLPVRTGAKRSARPREAKDA